MSSDTLRVGSRVMVEVHDMNSKGQGVAKLPDTGLVIFVDGLLPKESAEVEITTLKRDYAVGRVVKYIRLSPLRMDPLCPYYEECGGCQLQHFAYPHQFHFKLHKVIDEVERKLSASLPLDSYYHSIPLRYRNKLTFFIRDQGGMKIGFYKMNTHDLIDVKLCLLAHPIIENAYLQFRELLKEAQGKEWAIPYDESTGEGLLRNVTFRASFPVTADEGSQDNTSGISQVMTILTLNLRSYAKTPWMRDLEASLRGLSYSTSVLIDLNYGSNNRVLGGRSKILRGRLSLRQTFITKTLGRITYFYGPYNFFQVNPWVAVHMIDTAVEWLGDADRALDMYCGVGVFGIALAKAGVKEVTGVEIEPTAKKYVKKTLTENSLSPDRFRLLVGDANELELDISRYSAVIVDPPRKGLTPELIKSLSRAKQILYFSCNPATLVRDLIAFRSLGFSIAKARAYDMFPQTTHLELGVLLQR